MDGEVMDGERSTRTGLEGQVPGNSEQRARKPPGVHWERSPSQKLWWQESPLAGRVCRRPWFGRQTGLRNDRELGSRRKGSRPGTLGTGNVSPQAFHMGRARSPEQGQACGLKQATCSADDSGSDSPSNA